MNSFKAFNGDLINYVIGGNHLRYTTLRNFIIKARFQFLLPTNSHQHILPVNIFFFYSLILLLNLHKRKGNFNLWKLKLLMSSKYSLPVNSTWYIKFNTKTIWTGLLRCIIFAMISRASTLQLCKYFGIIHFLLNFLTCFQLFKKNFVKNFGRCTHLRNTFVSLEYPCI